MQAEIRMGCSSFSRVRIYRTLRKQSESKLGAALRELPAA